MTVLAAHNNLSIFPPPVSVQPSISTQPEDSVFDQLNGTPLPDNEINTILNSHDALSLTQVLETFNIMTTKMTRWLETAQMAVFTLELYVKEDSANMQDMMSLLELATGRMEPSIAILTEIDEIVQDKIDDNDEDAQKKMMVKMSITKIKSEWSGLQHFMFSVKNQLDNACERRELSMLMEKVLQQIDDLSMMMFQYQEKRQAAAMTTNNSSAAAAAAAAVVAAECSSSNEGMSSPLSTTSSGAFSPSTTTTTTATTMTTNTSFTDQSLLHAKHDSILNQIDRQVEPLFNDVQKIYSSMTSNSPPHDPTGALSRKHQMVQQRWEALRIEIDELKMELKEDRWLTVFRQVADQVDVMIDGLEKTVAHCYTVIQQTREWHAAQLVSNDHHQNAFQKISKSLLRRPTNGSSSPPPIDREKFKSIEKNFEAKYKYYIPSVGKMLAMLGNGIVNRVARDNEATKRHESTLQRWAQLKEAMDELRNRDLPETERMLSEESLSAQSRNGWKSLGYRSPDNENNLLRARSTYRSTSSLPKMNLNSSIHRYSYVGMPYDDEDNFRVRSVTPNSGSSLYSPVQGRFQQQQRAASSMAYDYPSTNNNNNNNAALRPSTSDSSSSDNGPVLRKPTNRQTKTPSRGSTEALSKESKSLVVERKSKVPRNNEEASFMKPTKSTILRTRRTQSVDEGTPDDRPKTPVTRSKTPNPGYRSSSSRKSLTPAVAVPVRPKSSLGGRQQQDEKTNLMQPPLPPRTASPYRRTMTPSLIPRPKTPQQDYTRAASPSLIPRPRSSMQQQHNSPPVRPASRNTYLTVPESEMIRRQLHKKQSMPAFRASSPQMFRRPATAAANYDDDEADRLPPLPRHGEVYRPNPKDPLDVEVAKVINASPISIKCQRGPGGGGKYLFGSELSPSPGGGKKMYTCKLMTYTDRRSSDKVPRNKVLVRVGGGWQDLEMFLLDHANLMTPNYYRS